MFIIFNFFYPLFSQTQNGVVNRYETSIIITSKHNLKQTETIEITIYNKQGEDLTHIEVPYSKKNKIHELEAGIYHTDGKIIRKLKSAEITDLSDISDFSLYEDDYVKSFDLRHNVYPYKIIYSYSIIYEDFFHIAKWNPVLYYETVTDYASLKLIIPIDYKINLYTHKINKTKIDTGDRSVCYEFISEYKKPLKHEIYSVPFYERLPSVNISPVEFEYGVPGKFHSWQSFGEWIYQLNEGLNDLTFSEKQKINDLIADTKSPREKINILYKYLQTDTRYINVSIDIGGIKPYPASYVCTNKYGDCKALSNYMKSMLEYVGIQSNYAVIRAGDNPVKVEEEELIDRSNHIILFVPLENDTIWMDCTNNYAPLGYLGTFTQNRYALITDRNNSKLIKTPSLSIQDVEDEILYVITPENAALAKLKISYNLKGSNYEMISDIYLNQNMDKIKKIIHQLVPVYNYELKNWKIKEDNLNDTSIQLDVELNVPDYYKSYADFIYTTLISIGIPDFEKPEKRTTDVRINYPEYQNETFILHPYSGFSYQLPTDTVIQSIYGSYTLNSEIKEGSLYIHRKLIINAGAYPISEYKKFYLFFQSIKSAEKNNPIILIKNK